MKPYHAVSYDGEGSIPFGKRPVPGGKGKS